MLASRILRADPVVPLESPGIVLRHPDSGLDDPDALPPSQFLPPRGEPRVDLDPSLRQQIAIGVIHDGCVVPARFMCRDGEAVDPAEIAPLYARERDWGAALVASELAGALGLDGFLHVHLARVVMDFGRFPGLTPPHASYLERFAINSPFAQWLGHEHKRQLLADWYDRISDQVEVALTRRTLTIGVHTYDSYNDSGTLRPELSVLNRTQGYQTKSRMPPGLFDPLFPDRLGEFTCDRVLPSRISLHLERAGVAVALNYPYCLPEGSVEVRSQVWHFFQWVRERMGREHPEMLDDPACLMVWRMLLDTNLRSSESDALRSALHMFRTPPRGRLREFEAARRAYERISAWVRQDGGGQLDAYRFGQGRPGAIGIEVRKDLVWEFDAAGRPIGPRRDQARRIAALLAEAIAGYLVEDRGSPGGGGLTG